MILKTVLLLTALFCAFGMAQESVVDSAAVDSSFDLSDTGATEPPMPSVTPAVVKPRKGKKILTECPAEMEYIVVRYNPKLVYEICVDRHEYPNQKGRYPTVNVTWYKANQLCEAQNKYLCSDREWLEACKGLNNWDYGYYNVFDAEKCNVQSEGISKIGDYDKCKTHNYEVFDLVGNVREWTSGGGVGAYGGNFKNGRGSRCSRWDPLSLKKDYPDVGFRCCVRIFTGRYGKVSRDILQQRQQQAPQAGEEIDTLAPALPPAP